ncbi:gp53-like domain-containing protein [Ewingella americana]|uniref:gp53-like domain-containing protein n=1 Tax=Ewingella americana TaxID=41202 RepID=UPI0012AD4390|nr:hypothetical protein [Ewingella americana]MRT01869.1 hypothetical protein [Ewingella americana]
MKRTDSPKKQPVPFGINGLREELLPASPAGSNAASYLNGYPAITMTLKTAGGLPPRGQDMNQILYELSSLSRWASSGATNSFDADFSSGIGGYPKGARILGDDGATIYISTIDDNTNNPNSSSTGWLNFTNAYLKVSNNFSEIFNSGAAAISEAKWNLLLNRYIQTDGDTQVRSPSGNQYLFVSNNTWGVFDLSTSGAIPLPVGTGGTGATSASGARANLGLGDAATKNTGTAAGTVAAGDDSRITGAMQKANNLSDLVSYSTARANMGLKGAALLDVGTTSGTVAAGDDSRITGALQRSNNLSELTSASAARTNLGAAALAGLSSQVFNVATATAGAHAVNLSQLNSYIASLSLGDASTRTVGTGTNQLPDMSSFTRGSGYFKLPNGIIVQYMQGTTNTTAAAQISYPIAFTSSVLSVVASAVDVNVPNYISVNAFNANACLLSAYTSGNVRAATNAFIIAIGI